MLAEFYKVNNSRFATFLKNGAVNMGYMTTLLEMNNQYLAPLVVFPHCIVLLLGSFAAWSGGRLCLRRPERRCHDLLHEGDFPPLLIASY